MHARVGTEFLGFLMTLMTFLCILAAGLSLSLNRMADLWTSGLANTAMIEIPSDQNKADILKNLQENLQKSSDVDSVKILSNNEIDKLVSPWLGKGTIAIADLPVPALITVELKERDHQTLEVLSDRIRTIAPGAKIDTHQDWLFDLAKLSRALQLASAVFVIIIAIVTALTVSGAVKSRMAIHHMELELLHLMGASDRYITRQFQKYIFMLVGKGIFAGAMVSFAVVGMGKLIMVKIPDTIPGFELALQHILVAPVIAAILLLISLLAARKTALNVLREMP